MISPIKLARNNGRPTVICTIGPACRSPKRLLSLIHAGMDVARLHFSYATHEEHTENIQRLRRAAAITGHKIGLLQDLGGAKVRLKDFVGGSAMLKQGTEFTLTVKDVMGDDKRASLNIPQMISAIARSDTILLADGALQLTAVTVTRDEARCRVMTGGRVKSHQAVHVPGKTAPVNVPTDKDKSDVLFGIQQGIDWIAQSFASTAREIQDLRKFIRRHGSDIPIVAKIEKREALENLDEIIAAADAVMIARGDLGLSIPLEDIAFAQKKITQRCKIAHTPVITATELLFSMMRQPRPSRAEVTDVTNAILEGSDAVMLSGESAMGRFPIEATRTLRTIVDVAHGNNCPRNIDCQLPSTGDGRKLQAENIPVLLLW